MAEAYLENGDMDSMRFRLGGDSRWLSTTWRSSSCSASWKCCWCCCCCCCCSLCLSATWRSCCCSQACVQSSWSRLQAWLAANVSVVVELFSIFSDAVTCCWCCWCCSCFLDRSSASGSLLIVVASDVFLLPLPEIFIFDYTLWILYAFHPLIIKWQLTSWRSGFAFFSLVLSPHCTVPVIFYGVVGSAG